MSDGNSPNEAFSHGKTGSVGCDVAYRDNRRALARALVEAVAEGRSGEVEALEFLRSIVGDDERAVRPLALLLVGDDAGIREMMGLVAEYLAG